MITQAIDLGVESGRFAAVTQSERTSRTPNCETVAWRRRRLCDQAFEYVNEVTIHNIMHRLWMKLNRPLTVL
jgi:hypothetical protein